MSVKVTFLFVGVGGQGVLSAAGYLGEAAFQKGLKVATSQLHGMSQRGGSVEAAVTVGSDRVLPVASQGVDVLLGLELIEAARARGRLAQGAVALCSRQVIVPPEASLKRLPVPDAAALLAEVGRAAAEVRVLDAVALAQQAGDAAALSAVMLGALSRLPQCPVSGPELLAALLQRSAPRHRDVNRRAFELGRATHE